MANPLERRRNLLDEQSYKSNFNFEEFNIVEKDKLDLLSLEEKIKSSQMTFVKSTLEIGNILSQAQEKLKNYEGTFTRGIAVGVVLCIVAAIPLLVAACMDAPDVVCTSFVSLLLILVACGVYMIIRVGIIKGSYDILLQEGDYTISEKKLKKKSDAFSGAYWCIATAIYLGWSFWTMRWDFTWIIWPVAGVLFAAVSGIFRAVMQNEKKKIE
jgi:hypothetical protein